MMYDPIKAEDLDSDMEDHCADSVRYASQSRPITPIIITKEKPILFDPLDQHKKVQPYRRV